MIKNYWKYARILILPMAGVFLMEGLLHILGTGYPTPYLLSRKVYASTQLNSNPFFAYRFFNPEIAPSPQPFQLNDAKPKGMIRIAVLGEMTGTGQSSRSFSLARGLDYQLNPPGSARRFEVIDASMPAIDSTVAAEISRGLVRQAVDVLIVCIGNNEMTGPFGIGAFIAGTTWGESLAPLQSWTTRYQTASLLHRIVAWYEDRQPKDEWPSMQMFRQDKVAIEDPRLELLRHRFSRNINRIVQLAEKEGIHTIVCTVPSNLSDSAPFGSTNRADLSDSQLRTWNDYFTAGVSAQEIGRMVEAREQYQKAATIDDQHAELNYRMAETWRYSGDHETARRLFSRACELDTHRLRADAQINDRIRAIAGKYPGAELVDLQMAFSTLDDRDLFLDHVHFSANGLQIACREILQKLATWCDVPPTATRDSLMGRMMRTPWSELDEAESMINRRCHPPFTGTAGNAQQIMRMERQKQYALERLAATGQDRWASAFSEKIRARPDDLALVEMWAGILIAGKQWREASDFLAGVIAPLAMYTDLHPMAACALAMDHKPEEAAELLARTGPPYGYQLSRAADSITSTLIDNNRKEDARIFLQALRGEAGRFPSYRKIAKQIE